MKKNNQAFINNHQLTGKVVRGEGYGRKLGFPTANIDRKQYVRDRLKIKLGVWAGVVQALDLPPRKAAIVIGPIDSKGLPKLEAHLINFKGNLYGKIITITLHKYLRAFKQFKSEAELKKQIGLDIKKIN
jgi:riboflavin kinase/FMN adenylyltransferase